MVKLNDFGRNVASDEMYISMGPAFQAFSPLNPLLSPKVERKSGCLMLFCFYGDLINNVHQQVCGKL